MRGKRIYGGIGRKTAVYGMNLSDSVVPHATVGQQQRLFHNGSDIALRAADILNNIAK